MSSFRFFSGVLIKKNPPGSPTGISADAPSEVPPEVRLEIFAENPEVFEVVFFRNFLLVSQQENTHEIFQKVIVQFPSRSVS